MGEALIIFTKNPVHGRVKTRLAGSIGESKALEIYQCLQQITADQCKSLTPAIDIHVFYSDCIEESDLWSDLDCQKHLQSLTTDLGQRMKDAFHQIFKMGYTSAIIIGTDCPYLTSSQLKFAFHELESQDIVIGPAADGGFYLLGVHRTELLNFQGMKWSTETVYTDYIQNISDNELLISTLPILEDIDDLTDFERFKNSPKFLNCN